MRVEKINDFNKLDFRFYGIIKHLYTLNILPVMGTNQPIQKTNTELLVAFKDDHVIGFLLLENGNLKHLSVDSKLTRKEKQTTRQILIKETKK